VNGTAHVDFEDRGDRTLMKYHADLQVGGRVASVGQRLLDSVGKAMSRKGLETVNDALTAGSVQDHAVPADLTGRPVARSSGGSPAWRSGTVRLWFAIAILLAIILVLVL
jgi:hypothetical protein